MRAAGALMADNSYGRNQSLNEEMDAGSHIKTTELNHNHRIETTIEANRKEINQGHEQREVAQSAMGTHDMRLAKSPGQAMHSLKDRRSMSRLDGNSQQRQNSSNTRGDLRFMHSTGKKYGSGVVRPGLGRDMS